MLITISLDGDQLPVEDIIAQPYRNLIVSLYFHIMGEVHMSSRPSMSITMMP